MRLNTILSSTSRSPKLSLPSRFSGLNFGRIYNLSMCDKRDVYFTLLNHPNMAVSTPFSPSNSVPVKASDLYLGDARFEPWSRYYLDWVFLLFSSEYSLNTPRALQRHFQFSIHYHPIIRQNTVLSSYIHNKTTNKFVTQTLSNISYIYSEIKRIFLLDYAWSYMKLLPVDPKRKLQRI
jgi:hypothetical protein